MPEGRRESDARRCEKAALVERMDAAFRDGDLEALRNAAGEDWGIPDGPMPMEIGPCLTYAIHRSPLPFIRELLEIGADPNPADHAGFPPLIAALWQSTRPDALAVVELLLSFGVKDRAGSPLVEDHITEIYARRIGIPYVKLDPLELDEGVEPVDRVAG